MTDQSFMALEHRKAIEPSGFLGSLYDAHRDVVKGKIFGNLDVTFEPVPQGLQCRSSKANKIEARNILEWMGFDQQQRINLYLNGNLQQGVAAFLDDPPLLDKETHFLYIHHVLSKESCSYDRQNIQESLESVSNKISPTHLITEILWGITALIVLQVPSGDSHKPIRNLQDAMRRENFDLDPSVCNQIKLISVYSNIRDLTSITELQHLCQRMREIRNSPSEQQRVEYGLTPLETLWSTKMRSQFQYHPVSSDTSDSLENLLLDRWSRLHMSRRKIQELMETSGSKVISLYEKLVKQKSDLLRNYEEQRNKIEEAVTNLRRDFEKKHLLERLLSDQTMKSQTEELTKTLTKIDDNLKFISDLEKKGIEYLDVSTVGIKSCYSRQLVNDILQQQGPFEAILCVNDKLRGQDQRRLNKHVEKLVKLRSENSQTKALCADFTYSSYELDQIYILPLHQEPGPSVVENRPVQPRKEEQKKTQNDQSPINILLLGQSGVGKSTFINAFVNYLRFSNLEDAENDEPTVVIPVSFTTTEGYHFQERVVKFGEPDPNENHNGNGQSVTEQCKAYMLSFEDGQKLCFIDTPGFGDTRGVDQDDFNMRQIFSFVNNLPHLNGICLLLKTNESELHPTLKHHVYQLIDYFDVSLRNLLIFCYTNARQTFFAPGDTIVPLRALLKNQKPLRDLVTSKEDIFCFDSESFRYLVARRQSIEFEDEDKVNYQKSWEESKREAIRLYKSLLDKKPLMLGEKFQTFGHARYCIELLIRPIYEAIRIIIYNLVLQRENLSIELRTMPQDHRDQVNTTTHRSLQEIGSLGILRSSTTKLNNQVWRSLMKSFPYAIDYEAVPISNQRNRTDLQTDLEKISRSCAKCSHFLNTSGSNFIDPFLFSLKLLMEDEMEVDRLLREYHTNQQVYQNLKAWRESYEREQHQLARSSNQTTLSDIYRHLDSLKKISWIKVQCDAIEGYQKTIFNKNQRIIPNCSSKYFEDSF